MPFVIWLNKLSDKRIEVKSNRINFFILVRRLVLEIIDNDNKGGLLSFENSLLLIFISVDLAAYYTLNY